VLKYDTVAFDEVAGANFRSESDKQMYKGYMKHMKQGSFSRGDDKGTLSADAGMVFNGNMDGDVETTARISPVHSLARAHPQRHGHGVSRPLARLPSPVGRCPRCSRMFSRRIWA